MGRTRRAVCGRCVMPAYIVAVLLALHGLVHVLGFGATWRIGPAGAVSASPDLLPGFAAGSPAVQFLGILWLAAMAAFVAGAIGLATHAGWWRLLAAGAAALSLALCVAWWSDAKAGAVIDVVILLGLVATAVTSRPAFP